jgi:tRNA-specific adenosine deaminase 1
MELIMAEQLDATPWNGPLPAASDMLGRGHFDQLGVVRRKPARADAPATLSKSCSDKLALKQVTGLLSSITSKLVWPGNVYLSSLILPEGQVVPMAVERAWGRTGSMSSLNELDKTATRRWEEAGYSFRPFSVLGTTRIFEYSKPNPRSVDVEKAVPSNLSAVHTPHASEVLINGVLQGRQQFDVKGASCISRRKMWQAVGDAAALARDAAEQDEDEGISSGMKYLVANVVDQCYSEMKLRCHVRQEVKDIVKEVALEGWMKNEGDDQWKLDKSM